MPHLLINLHLDTSRVQRAYEELLAIHAQLQAELLQLKSLALRESRAKRKRRQRKKKH